MSLVVNIQKKYKGFQLDVAFECNNTSLGLLGASGCGKSLTLKCIAGIETPDCGKIILNNRILFDSERGINLTAQQRNVGILFQNYALFPHMTVKSNIEIGIRSKKEKQRKLAELAQIFRLEGMLNKYPSELSGGEQQRVALARSIALEPELLMLDEPFHALDSYLKEQLQQELSKMLLRYQGKIIMVSHSRYELYYFCKYIAVVNNGKIIENGSREELFRRPTKLSSARLTGCRNISRAEKVSDYLVKALDWNTMIHTNQFVQQEINYIGIRSHNIKAGVGTEKENLLAVDLAELSEGPYECHLFLKSKNNISGQCNICWTVPKQQWYKSLQGKLPGYISFPKEDILLLRDDS